VCGTQLCTFCTVTGRSSSPVAVACRRLVLPDGWVPVISVFLCCLYDITPTYGSNIPTLLISSLTDRRLLNLYLFLLLRTTTLRSLIQSGVTLSVPVADSKMGDTEFPKLYLHPQYYTEKYLEECLRGDGGRAVEYGAVFEGLVESDDGRVITATVRRGGTRDGQGGKVEEITAKYVVAADGARSKVREAVGIQLHRTQAESAFVVADLKLSGAESPCRKLPGVHVMLTKDGMFLLLPLPDEVLRAYFQVPAGTKKEDLVLNESFFEQQLKDMCGIECKVELGPWQTVFDITYGVSEAYRKRHVFLAGDAAHVHSPIGGQVSRF